MTPADGELRGRAPKSRGAATATTGRPEPVVAHQEPGHDVRQQPPPPETPRPRRALDRPGLVAIGVFVIVAVPLVVAIIALAGQHWYPTGDLAQAEMRMRSFWAHPPLVGAAGRIGTLAEQGNHPGPLMFWAAWPGYWIFGRSSWALLTSVALLNALTAGAILAVGYRRGGLRLLLGFAAMVALLLRAYGAGVLVQPWNPSMPLLPWLLFLVLVWSVLCGDLVMLPFVFLAGSYCVQCHVGYTALVGGLLVVAVVGAFLAERHTVGGTRRLARWLGLSVGLGVVAWLPPIIDQLINRPGNLRILYDYFAHPSDKVLGASGGFRLILVQLDPFGGWLTGRQATGHPLLPGALLLVVWLVGVNVAWRRHHHALLRLHVVVAAALVVAVLSAARIFGAVFVYLVKWSWGITALMVFATVWSLGLLVAERLDHRSRPQGVRVAGVIATAILLGSTIAFAIQAAGVDVPGPPFSATIAQLAPATASQLDHNGRYVVQWEDPIGQGADGFGMILELERRGFHVGAPVQFRKAVEPHRVLTAAAATASLHVVTGPTAIGSWRATPGARQIAYADPRTSAERREYSRLLRDVTDRLRASGHSNLIPSLQTSELVVALAPGLPDKVVRELGRMVAIGLPVAVFITSPSLVSPAPARA